MIVVDSSVWIDYLCTGSTPETDYLNDILGSRPIGVGDLILAEVLQGFRIQREYDAARRELLEFPLVLMGGRDNAIAAANHYRHLRSQGITIRGLVDCLIAAAVIAGDHILLHNDRHFDHFERHFGLQVLHPS
jgi:predicted nucleic acid-binding protein